MPTEAAAVEAPAIKYETHYIGKINGFDVIEMTKEGEYPKDSDETLLKIIRDYEEMKNKWIENTKA